MKDTTIGRVIAGIFWFVFAILAVALYLGTVGCGSTRPEFESPALQPVAFEIPVPPSEMECPAQPRLVLADTDRGAVEADGAVLVQAFTLDLATVLQQNNEFRVQCNAHNEARAVVLKAQIEAMKRFEEFKAENE